MRFMSLWQSIAFPALLLMASTAGAGSIASYTVTDLGVVPYDEGSVHLSAPTGSDATLTAPDGAIYAFPRTDNRLASSLLPALSPQDRYDSAFLNSNNIAIAAVATLPPISDGGSGVEVFQKVANGTFARFPFDPSSSLTLPGGPNSSGTTTQVFDLNKINQFLSVSGSNIYNNFDQIYRLTDLATMTNVNLADLLPGWHLDYGAGKFALDDQGRMLVYGVNPPGYQGSKDYQEHALLLTPAGLSSTPLSAPEPTTLATLALAGLGLAIRRRWKSRGPAAASR